MTDGERLPRGRHGLSRAEVADSQRSRMLQAMAEAMTEKGFVGTTVADIIGRAGVSRETFYQQFSSKTDCFTAAFDTAGDTLLDRLAALDPSGPPLERFDRILTRYLDALADHPAEGRLFLVEVYAAGPEAIARRADLQARITDTLVGLLGLRSELDHFACQVLVAAVGSLVIEPVVAQDADAIRALRAPVIELVERALSVEGIGAPARR